MRLLDGHGFDAALREAIAELAYSISKNLALAQGKAHLRGK